MPILENKYKAAATAELECSVRKLEERNKVAQSKSLSENDISVIQGNISFAERIHLIGQIQAQNLRKRILQAQQQYQKLMKTEILDRVDDFENPREREQRFRNLDKYQEKIAKEKSDLPEKADQHKPKTMEQTK